MLPVTMSSRPTGTVTFLFTDIEGSTRMWEQHRAEMPAALEQHDDLLRDAIEASGGYVFTTAGDAFSAAFADPGAALHAAISGQRGLESAEWGEIGSLRVRMALHSGVAHERDGDYFGPALNRVARILSAGHGGQILMSLGTQQLMGGSPPDGVTIRDLGEHTLKDLGRPEHIYQVVHPGLRSDFPDLVSLDAYPNNLPIQLTSFIGRDVELRDVVKRLHDNRLVTLTGVGGSGKTRLSLQAAAESAQDYPHGVWLVELASIGDPDLVPTAIAEVVGLGRSQGGSGNTQLGSDGLAVLDQLTDHFRSRTALVVLDNCEHLITATARVVQHLLQHCPDLTVLATSREGLGVPGEALWQVPSLAANDGDPFTNDAVQLFVDRAQDANPRFTADADALRAIQQVCERLDGMPLAIELAAARARILDAQQSAERLDDRFRLLTGGSRTALPRHQTLEATVDWSYELMSDAEKSVFQRLAAFRGGFTLEAAEAVTSGGEVDAYDVLDLIGQLVDKSMVVRDEISGRFGMLETLRQYALRRLAESQEVDAVRLRHAEFFHRFAKETNPKLNGPDEAAAYEQLTADHDNVRAAIQFCLENDHEELAARITSPMGWYWWASSDTLEGLDWILRVLPFREQLDPGTRAELLAGAALFGGFQRREGSADYAHQAIDIATEAGDARAEGLAHMALGYTVWVRSEFDAATEHTRRMIECGERAGDAWMVANAYLLTAFAHRLMSRLDEAAVAIAASEEAYRRAGQPSGLGWVLTLSAQIDRYRGDFEAEVVKTREARTIFERIGAPFQIGFVLTCESLSLTLLGRNDEAVAAARRAIDLVRDLASGDQGVEAFAMSGWVEREAGNLLEAADSFEESLRLAEAALDPKRLLFPAIHLGYLALDAGLPDRAAALIAFHHEYLTRPWPGIYRDHFATADERVDAELGSEEATRQRAMGAGLDGVAAHRYMTETIEMIRAGLAA
jgi:predicted ATPase/class 3 adenylate cyclase